MSKSDKSKLVTPPIGKYYKYSMSLGARPNGKTYGVAASTAYIRVNKIVDGVVRYTLFTTFLSEYMAGTQSESVGAFPPFGATAITKTEYAKAWNSFIAGLLKV